MTLVSVLVAALPAQARGPASLATTVGSLRYQDMGDWEVLVASPTPLGHELRGSGRIRKVVVPGCDDDDPDQRATLLQAAADQADGRYLAVMAPGDHLEPGALGAVALVAEAAGYPPVVYTDEQWPGDGASGIARKPDFLPTLLESFPYLGRLLLVRADVFAEVGGFVPGTAGAEEHDLALRVTERYDDVAHVPVVALTRPEPPDTGPDARAAVVRAVERRLARTGRTGTVEATDPPLGVRTWLTVTEPPLVSLVIPTVGTRREVRGEPRVLVEACVRSVLDCTTYPRWEVVAATSEPTPPAVVDTLQTLLGDRLRLAPVAGAFNFSTSVNEGARVATGELLLLLNDDTEVIEPRWLERMVAVAADPKVGVVGAKLLFEEGTLQHVGVTFDDDWGPIHALGSETDDDAGPWGAKVLDTDWAAVTGACLLTPARLFEEVGGFDENLPLNFNDLDYCFKVGRTGRRIVTTPFARLWHYESASRGHRLEQWEVDALHRSWHLRIRQDPHVTYRSVW